MSCAVRRVVYPSEADSTERTDEPRGDRCDRQVGSGRLTMSWHVSGDVRGRAQLVARWQIVPDPFPARCCNT